MNNEHLEDKLYIWRRRTSKEKSPEDKYIEKLQKTNISKNL
jgi:hypothetical protein